MERRHSDSCRGTKLNRRSAADCTPSWREPPVRILMTWPRHSLPRESRGWRCSAIRADRPLRPSTVCSHCQRTITSSPRDRSTSKLTRHTTPTLYLVLSCVTLNRKQRDAELVVGTIWLIAATRQTSSTTGWEMTPARIDSRSTINVSLVEDDQLGQPRLARDHREEVLSLWMQRRQPTVATNAQLNAELNEVARQATAEKLQDPVLAKEIAKTLGLAAVGSLADSNFRVAIYEGCRRRASLVQRSSTCSRRARRKRGPQDRQRVH